MPVKKSNKKKATAVRKPKKKTVNRSAKSGRFVTERFAKHHKATTTKEKVK